MPTKPKHPCAYPGCPELTDGRYCAAHKKLTDRQYDRYGRDPAGKKRYGRTWRKVRERFLKAHPLCEMCLQPRPRKCTTSCLSAAAAQTMSPISVLFANVAIRPSPPGTATAGAPGRAG